MERNSKNGIRIEARILDEKTDSIYSQTSYAGNFNKSNLNVLLCLSISNTNISEMSLSISLLFRFTIEQNVTQNYI